MFYITNAPVEEEQLCAVPWWLWCSHAVNGAGIADNFKVRGILFKKKEKHQRLIQERIHVRYWCSNQRWQGLSKRLWMMSPRTIPHTKRKKSTTKYLVASRTYHRHLTYEPFLFGSRATVFNSASLVWYDSCSMSFSRQTDPGYYLE